MKGDKGRTILERFMESVNSDWQWISGKIPQGYGVIKISGKNKRAHRVSYELFNGPIPDGMMVLHSCDDPGCVNPDHLHLGTQSMNAQEMWDRGRASKNCVPMHGTKNGRCKFTDEKLVEIRNSYKSIKNLHEISAMFGISYSYANKIVKMRRRK